MNDDELPSQDAPFTRAQTERGWPTRHIGLQAWASEERYLRLCCGDEPWAVTSVGPHPRWDWFIPELGELFHGEPWVPPLEKRMQKWLADVVEWENVAEPYAGRAGLLGKPVFDFDAHHREGVALARKLSAGLGPNWTVDLHGSLWSGCERDLLWTSRDPDMPLKSCQPRWRPPT